MFIRAAFMALCLMFVASTSFAYDKAVSYIRNAHFTKCKHKTVGAAIDDAFEKASWESGTGSRGEILVNAQGIVTWGGQRYRAVIQFEVKGDGFKTNAVSFNGKVQDENFKVSFVNELCRD